MKCSNKGANPIRYRNRKEPATIDKAMSSCLGARQARVQRVRENYKRGLSSPCFIRCQQDARALIAERVRGEFREMPGLTLTLAQAVKLWSLDVATCTDVLSYLVTDGYLCRRADGAFCRASDLAGRRLAQA